MDDVAPLLKRINELMRSQESGRHVTPAIRAGLKHLSKEMRSLAPVRARRIRKRQLQKRMARMARKGLNAITAAKYARTLKRSSILNNPNRGKPGSLRKAIRFRVRRPQRGIVRAKVGINVGIAAEAQKDLAPHAHLVAIGTDYRSTRSGRNRGKMPPNDFIDRAMSSGAGPALALIEQEHAQSLNAHVQSLGGSP